MEENQRLLQIVKSWSIRRKPEFRRFRCANCQQFLSGKVYQHLLDVETFFCPVHFCNSCEKQFQKNVITHAPEKMQSIFSNSYLPELQEVFTSLISAWGKKTVELKELICDYCQKELVTDYEGCPQGWHVWWKDKENRLIELHFDALCAHKIGIKP